jgi:3-aminobutyryl-CoA ammonia-lyase
VRPFFYLEQAETLSGGRVTTQTPQGGASLSDLVSKKDSVTIRVRMGLEDAHYAGGLVDGAHMLKLFGDVATELLIRHDGDEGLFRAYSEVEFLAPVYAGDYIEASGSIISVGRTSRKMVFEAKKVIALSGLVDQPSAADVLTEPVVVTRAQGTCVVPAECQRTGGSNG